MAKTIVKLADIGDQLGLSVSTVSAVLNNRKTRHSSETRKRVIELAKKLDYRPNYAARSMRTNRTLTVGILAPLLSAELDELEESCSSGGYVMSVGLFHNDLERQASQIHEFKQRNIDGLLIIHPLKGCSVINELHKSQYPIVLVDVADNYQDIDTFFVDIQKAITVAINHLRNLGHRAIAMINHEGKADYGRLRLDVWARMMLEAGNCDYQDYYYHSKMKYPKVECIIESAYKSAKTITQQYNKDDQKRPTAVLAVADKIALGAIKAFEDAGWNVPGDISVVSAESSEYSKYLSRPLTTVHTYDRTIQNEAICYLMSLIDGRDKNLQPIKKFNTVELQIGKTTAQCPF